jgi:hypothetical protein
LQNDDAGVCAGGKSPSLVSNLWSIQRLVNPYPPIPRWWRWAALGVPSNEVQKTTFSDDR